jgi:hypothetical protein
VAKLAFSIGTCLRSKDRSRYSSENQLLEFLRSGGVSFATKDVNPALTLLESMDMLIRPPVPPNIARPAWLPASTDAPVPMPVLIDAVIRVLNARLCASEVDLQACLNAAGVAFDSPGPEDSDWPSGRLGKAYEAETSAHRRAPEPSTQSGSV